MSEFITRVGDGEYQVIFKTASDEKYHAVEDFCREIIDHGKPSGWISVKDRLPEERINPNTNDFEYVLCATTFGDVRAYKYGMIDGNIEAHFWHGFGMVDKYITHWMPFPEPPKEE